MNPNPEDPALRGAVPDYLARTYRWAYLSPRMLGWLDRDWIVSAILWGNARRLMRAAVAECRPGERVFQAACVYGEFLPLLARRLGPAGALSLVDASVLQLDNAVDKLATLPDGPRLVVRCADLAEAPPADERAAFDAASCFFLLHEVPASVRPAIVGALLERVRPGGRVVFVDYHWPKRWHPLGPLMWGIWRALEPYAPSLFETEIATLAPQGVDFRWRKRTLFGGLYQLVVGERRG